MANLTMKSQGTRAIGAIMWKDIVDAFKNKEILSVFATIVFLIALYYYLPLLWGGNDPQRIRVYDANGSSVIDALDASSEFRVFSYESQQTMLEDMAIASYDTGELGLVVPASAELALIGGNPLQLDGYLLHWMSDKDSLALQANVEQALSQEFGVPVQINMDGHTVYSRADSMGRSFSSSVALAIVFCLGGIMIAPKLMLEERETHTLDALLVSPASYGQIVVGKTLTALLLTMMASIAVIAVNSAIIVQWPLVMLAAVLGSLFSVALGLLLGLLFDNKQKLTMWTMIIIQPLLVPVFLTIMNDLIPAGVIRAMRYLPPVALSYVVRQSFAQNAPLSAWGADIALAAGATGLLLAACVWLVRRSDR